MDRDLEGLLSDAAESEGEVHLTEAELRQLTPKDVPAGAIIRLGHREQEHQVQDWDGYLAVDDQGDLGVYVEVDIWPKFWTVPLGARHYIDVMHRSVARRARTHRDVEVVEFDVSDDTNIRLIYRVRVSSKGDLLSWAENAKTVQQEIEHPVDQIVDEVDRTVARAGHLLAKGAFDPLPELLKKVDLAKSSREKGLALEELVAAAVQQVPDFTILARNCNTETEEIDVSVLNGSSDPIFSKEGSIVLIECKNWIANVPRSEVSSLETKIRNRRQRCTLSYFISWADLSRKAHLELLRHSRESFVIAPINGSALRSAVGAGSAAVVDLFRSSFTQAIHK
jgi:Holliday junction resolvase-like predicted endonuclease